WEEKSFARRRRRRRTSTERGETEGEGRLPSSVASVALTRRTTRIPRQQKSRKNRIRSPLRFLLPLSLSLSLSATSSSSPWCSGSDKKSRLFFSWRSLCLNRFSFNPH
ncbi:unnamed protein product, partial [Musa acuminata subsp. burmannicoides]